MGDGNRSSQPVNFNLAEQSGVLQALLAVRSSTLSAAEKTDLRDEIFTYTKSGGDARLREQIEQKLQNLPVTEEFVTKQQQQKKQEARAGFAGARRTPSFSIPQPVAPATPSAQPASAIPADLPVAEVAPDVVPIRPDPQPEPATKKVPVQSATTSSESPAPAAPTSAQVATPQPDTTESTAPEAASTTAPDSTPASGSVAPNNPTIDRIREIKRYINEKIGNPVNLVDIDNTLGRAYMSALLAAMQSVNAETGRAGDVEMRALEDVFVQVKDRLQEQSADDSSAPAQAPVVETASQPPVAPSQTAAPAAPVAPAPSAPTVAPIEPVTPTQPEVAGSPDAPADQASERFSTEPVQPVAPTEPIAKVDPAPSMDIPKKVESVAAPSLSQQPTPTPSTPVAPVAAVSTDTNDTADAPAAPKSGFTQSVATEHSTIANQVGALDAQAAKQQFAGDPLYAPEIDAGLQQLLLEWNLFKSSGLFGTGPNGREHPLFKKLAPLMIQDVAEGRFDDSRPEVVQSITDYMNGWRFEQGIVYEPGESFEKYLRRVIRFIIDGK